MAARLLRQLPARARAVIRQRRYDAIAARHLALRLRAVRAELAAAEPGFVFLAGNSHAELLGGGVLDGRPVVNGGIGGTSTRGYATQLDHLAFATRASAAILWAGSNDILRRGRTTPLSDRRCAGFDAAVVRTLIWLQARADRVLVAAVPPIGAEDATREAGAVAAYSARLARLSAIHGCRFFDPFTDIRDGATGLAQPGAVQGDGVHLADYQRLRASVATVLAGER